jgi:serine protease Do
MLPREFRMSTVLAFLLVALCATHVHAQPSAESRAMLRAMEEAFTSVADRVMPSVVNVSTVPKKGGAASTEEIPEQFREFFEEFRRRAPREPRATGSGVIVDPNGYILTNNHVIENAAEVTVRLFDSRKFTAKVVGRDPKTDLAVLKVEVPGPLPAAELGDSDALRIGQFAIAIGNPFGLDHTVTVGIISGTARTRVGVATYESFIQTDASINPGNSGGPLLNIDGRVIGVNTAIVAAGQGIGFAIPINMVRDVMRQLIAGGRVVRGWLGIVIQDLTDELAPSFGVAERAGVLVADVVKNGPAEAGGVRSGDVIVELAGTPIKEVPDLQRRVAAVPPGQQVEIKVSREGQVVPLRITVGEMPGEESLAAAERTDEAWGLHVEPLTAEVARQLNLSVTSGVVVTEVATGGPAESAGLRRGDAILEVDGQPVSDASSLDARLKSTKAGQPARVYVERPGPDGGRRFLVLARPDAP